MSTSSFSEKGSEAPASSSPDQDVDATCLREFVASENVGRMSFVMGQLKELVLPRERGVIYRVAGAALRVVALLVESGACCGPDMLLLGHEDWTVAHFSTYCRAVGDACSTSSAQDPDLASRTHFLCGFPAADWSLAEAHEEGLESATSSLLEPVGEQSLAAERADDPPADHMSAWTDEAALVAMFRPFAASEPRQQSASASCSGRDDECLSRSATTDLTTDLSSQSVGLGMRCQAKTLLTATHEAVADLRSVMRECHFVLLVLLGASFTACRRLLESLEVLREHLEARGHGYMDVRLINNDGSKRLRAKLARIEASFNYLPSLSVRSANMVWRHVLGSNMSPAVAVLDCSTGEICAFPPLAVISGRDAGAATFPWADPPFCKCFDACLARSMQAPQASEQMAESFVAFVAIGDDLCSKWCLDAVDRWLETNFHPDGLIVCFVAAGNVQAQLPLSWTKLEPTHPVVRAFADGANNEVVLLSPRVRHSLMSWPIKSIAAEHAACRVAEATLHRAFAARACGDVRLRPCSHILRELDQDMYDCMHARPLFLALSQQDGEELEALLGATLEALSAPALQLQQPLRFLHQPVDLMHAFASGASRPAILSHVLGCADLDPTAPHPFTLLLVDVRGTQVGTALCDHLPSASFIAGFIQSYLQGELSMRSITATFSVIRRNSARVLGK